MAYEIYEIPLGSGLFSDVVVADVDNQHAPAYFHYSYTIGSTSNENELTTNRTIPFRSMRNWEYISRNFPDSMRRLKEKQAYYPGESVLSENSFDSNIHVKTVLRLGALELLANIFSGRITPNDKDPFPHQLSFQHYMKTCEDKRPHLLIADEVGLGKTIEIGLVLRDLLVSKGRLDQFRCLYLTSGGLLEDVLLKLKPLMQGAVDEENIVQVTYSFKNYGLKTPIFGIHVASMDAARRYVKKSDQKYLPINSKINPDILIIDECHSCASEGTLNNSDEILTNATTQTYKAAFKLISGTFWSNSEPPRIVVLMSATPFRSQDQFLNLLRLLNHNTSTIPDAYADNISGTALVDNLRDEKSAVSVIWRQQDDVHNWNGKRLFPNLRIERKFLNTNPAYLELISEICEKLRIVSRDYGETFGGFSVRQLQTRLTSSSVAGACYIFRWCVRHQKWDSKENYKQDNSACTNALRNFIIEISKRLAQYDQRNTSVHADIYFPSDDFKFTAKSIAQPKSTIPEIYDFYEQLVEKDDDEDRTFIAESANIIELINLGSKLLNLTAVSEGSGVENSKLNWLKEILDKFPNSRFLLFTESLQTCEIITKALPIQCDKLVGSMSTAKRNKVVSKFRNLNSSMRILVATSAADEGFDFQVANNVIHWDLSPSPAVLMQRNGRVARLGQISDVTAYYLIMEGTHEEKRDKALHDRFINLGISDERLRLKILGALSKDEEEIIMNAIDVNDLRIIDSILENAKRGNEDMEDKLKQTQKELKDIWVIDRDNFASRLEQWVRLGIPPYIQEKLNINIQFDKIAWKRPVFKDVASMEEALAKVAIIKTGRINKKITFDPEFKVFGQVAAEPYSLAGLIPWTKREQNDGTKLRPVSQIDPIGELASCLARQRQADFTIISSDKFYENFPDLKESIYLLFATHPIRELELDSSEREFCYLTFYSFNKDFNEPIKPKGASAKEVYRLISLLEADVAKLPFNKDLTEKAKQAGYKIGDWLKKTRKTGGGFIKESYFLPIPVALIAVI
jgi:superfamily II DNA or RNA helicase